MLCVTGCSEFCFSRSLSMQIIHQRDTSSLFVRVFVASALPESRSYCFALCAENVPRPWGSSSTSVSEKFVNTFLWPSGARSSSRYDGLSCVKCISPWGLHCSKSIIPSKWAEAIRWIFELFQIIGDTVKFELLVVCRSVKCKHFHLTTGLELLALPPRSPGPKHLHLTVLQTTSILMFVLMFVATNPGYCYKTSASAVVVVIKSGFLGQTWSFPNPINTV